MKRRWMGALWLNLGVTLSVAPAMATSPQSCEPPTHSLEQTVSELQAIDRTVAESGLTLGRIGYGITVLGALSAITSDATENLYVNRVIFKEVARLQRSSTNLAMRIYGIGEDAIELSERHYGHAGFGPYLTEQAELVAEISRGEAARWNSKFAPFWLDATENAAMFAKARKFNEFRAEMMRTGLSAQLGTYREIITNFENPETLQAELDDMAKAVRALNIRDAKISQQLAELNRRALAFKNSSPMLKLSAGAVVLGSGLVIYAGFADVKQGLYSGGVAPRFDLSPMEQVFSLSYGNAGLLRKRLSGSCVRQNIHRLHESVRRLIADDNRNIERLFRAY